MTVIRKLPTVSVTSTDYLASNTQKKITGVNVVGTSSAIDSNDVRYNVSTSVPINSYTKDKSTNLIVTNIKDNEYPGLQTNLDTNLVIN